MTEQEKYMKAALKLAQKAADEGEVPVGAVVVCDGKIVGRGRNRRETKKNALHHAEIEAIEKACKKLGGCGCTAATCTLRSSRVRCAQVRSSTRA